MVLDGRAPRDGLDHLDLALDEPFVEANHRERLARTHARHAAGDARLGSMVRVRARVGVSGQSQG